MLPTGEWQERPKELAGEISVSAFIPFSHEHCVNCGGDSVVRAGP